MTTILQILASPRPHSFGRRMAREVTARLVRLNPGTEIVERDLAADPPPHPDLDFCEAILSPVPDDDPDQVRRVCAKQRISAPPGAPLGSPDYRQSGAHPSSAREARQTRFLLRPCCRCRRFPQNREFFAI
jgi:NAD(P)H-dependent FMN reductase